MGRITQYRQRIRTQAASVEGKGLLEYLAGHIKARREISIDEAVLVAKDVLAYINSQILVRPFGQLELPVIAGRETHRRNSRNNQEEKLVNLTVVAEDDAELMRDFGIHTMQNARLARVIEEAYYQDAILDGRRLQVLFPMNHKAIRNHLKEFWEAGCILPVAGMTKEHRHKMRELRPVTAVRSYLSGEDLTGIQRRLAISSTRWNQWWRSFRQTVLLGDEKSDKISEILGEPEILINGWQSIYQEFKNSPTAQERLAVEHLQGWERPELGKDAFRQTLMQRHGFSPAAAEEFIDEIHELMWHFRKESREPGEIGYIAVSADEPPGRSLVQSDLVFCRLEYLAPSDWEIANRNRPGELKWERLQRLATQAYNQGATLTQPDLAFMLGVSVEAVRQAMKAHDKIVLPTRGRVTDMGPAISHAEKIIKLWMDGYTETEILRRTGHSYESIEKYLFDFAKIVYLLEKEMPVSAIRTVTGLSRKVVERYVALYQEYVNNPDGWRLGQLRRMGEARAKKIKRKVRQ